MIIKELRIKNFRSYYGDNNRFVFSEGLTLIIGEITVMVRQLSLKHSNGYSILL